MKRARVGNLSTRLDKLEAQKPATEQEPRLFAEGSCSLMTHDESSFARCILMHLKPDGFADWQLCGIVVNSTTEAVMLRLVERLEDRLAALANLPADKKKEIESKIAESRKMASTGLEKLDETGDIKTRHEDIELLSAVSIFDHWQGREPGPEIFAEKFRVAHDTLTRVGAICSSVNRRRTA